MALIYINDPKTFGLQIKKERERSGYKNIKSLEAAIGISDERLGQIEDGLVFGLRSATMDKLCKFFNLSQQDLLGPSSQEYIAENKTSHIDPITEKINELLPHLSEEGKREVLRYTEEKKLLMGFLKKEKKTG